MRFPGLLAAAVLFATVVATPVFAEDAAGLASLLPSAAEVSGSWEILREAAEPPDPDLRARGLHASVARRYTRARGPVSEVCTLELWGFAAPVQARSVAGALASSRPAWEFHTEGPVLLMAHGLRLERGVGTRRGVEADCAELVAQTRSRLSAR